jgi:hypothetical protein
MWNAQSHQIWQKSRPVAFNLASDTASVYRTLTGLGGDHQLGWIGDAGERTARDFVSVSRKSQSGPRRKAHNSLCRRRAIVPPWKAGGLSRDLQDRSLGHSGTVLAFDPAILLNMVLITIIHFNSLAQPLAILLSVPSALLSHGLSFVCCPRLYSGFARKSATLTEPAATPQPSRI